MIGRERGENPTLRRPRVSDDTYRTNDTHTQRFYRARQGAGWDRRVTIVSGLTQAGVDACGMLDRDSEIWLNWSDGDDASLHQFRWVGQCRVCVRGGSDDTSARFYMFVHPTTATASRT